MGPNYLALFSHLFYLQYLYLQLKVSMVGLNNTPLVNTRLVFTVHAGEPKLSYFFVGLAPDLSNL